MRACLLLAAGLVFAVAACGGGEERAAPDTVTATPTQAEGPAPPRKRPRSRRPPAPRCGPGASNCTAASGRIVALESKDPDGDGDLHVVLAGGSVTLPGVTVLDVSAELRPRRDPRIGDWAAGAGPVYAGSLGQHQIEVDRVVFFPRRG